MLVPQRKFISILLLAFLVARPVCSEDIYRLKAAFLVNFSKFVRWPTEKKEGFTLCVFRENVFHNERDFFKKASRTRSITTKFIESFDERLLRSCDIFFVPRSQLSSLPQIKLITDGYPVLTVTEEGPGGVIEFIVVEGRLRFKIDRELAQKRNLSINSHLLQLSYND